MTDIVDLRSSAGVDRNYVYKIRAVTVRDIASIGASSTISSVNDINNQIVSRVLHLIDRYGNTLLPADITSFAGSATVVPFYGVAPDVNLFGNNQTSGMTFNVSQSLSLLNGATLAAPTNSGLSGNVWYDSLSDIPFS